MPPKKKTTPSKRKADAPPPSAPDDKATKTEATDDAAQASHATTSDPLKTLRWLLSEAATELIEDEEVGNAERSYRTPPGQLSPFEEIICAMTLAKPISHRLGLRSIKTLLNEPYTFSTPGEIIDAGEETIYKALDEARTQHKDKTAASFVGMAQTMIDDFDEPRDDGSLSKLREKAGRDAAKERDLLEKSIKGIGKMAVDLLFRRLQATWLEIYPFADKRTLAALESLGLPGKSAEGVVELMENHWDELRDVRIGEGETEKAATFALLCDRAIAIELDKQGGRALEEIGDK